MSGMTLAAFGAGEMQPLFVDAGAGAIEAPISGTLQLPYPATMVNRNFLIAQVVSNDSVGGSVTLPAGWTGIGLTTSTDLRVQTRTFYKIADGTETGNLDVTCSGDVFAAGRIYRLSHGSSIEAVGGANTDSSGTGLSAVNVTTLGNARLAVQAMCAIVNTTVGDISGESGADYAEAIGEYSTASGPVILSLQIASVATATAITGGSAMLASAGTYRIRQGFAVLP